MLLHAAREPLARQSEIGVAWGGASDQQREEVRGLAKELDAEVALAAAVGGLDAFRHRREYALWQSGFVGPAGRSTFLQIISKARAAPSGSRRVAGAFVAWAFRAVARRLPQPLRFLSNQHPPRPDSKGASRQRGSRLAHDREPAAEREGRAR